MEPQKIIITNEMLSQLEKFTGTFDVHITVDDRQIYLVNQFCQLNHIELAYAIGDRGRYKQQLMTSTYVMASTGRRVLEEAIELSCLMERAGIHVLRIKIETLASCEFIKEFMKTEEYQKNPQYYYEFHFKVAVKSALDQQKLEKVCELHNVSYAINFLSKNRRDPLISYRLRGDYDKALQMKENFLRALKLQGLTPLIDGTHNEFAIYDSNYKLDEGLLLPAVEITESPTPMISEQQKVPMISEQQKVPMISEQQKVPLISEQQKVPLISEVPLQQKVPLISEQQKVPLISEVPLQQILVPASQILIQLPQISAPMPQKVAIQQLPVIKETTTEATP